MRPVVDKEFAVNPFLIVAPDASIIPVNTPFFALILFLNVPSPILSNVPDVINEPPTLVKLLTAEYVTLGTPPPPPLDEDVFVVCADISIYFVIVFYIII